MCLFPVYSPFLCQFFLTPINSHHFLQKKCDLKYIFTQIATQGFETIQNGLTIDHTTIYAISSTMTTLIIPRTCVLIIMYSLISNNRVSQFCNDRWLTLIPWSHISNSVLMISSDKDTALLQTQKQVKRILCGHNVKAKQTAAVRYKR